MNDLTQKTETVWIEVLVDAPGARDLYTYRMSEDTAVQPGDIVSVPFGPTQAGGIAIRQLDSLPEGLNPSSIKTIESIINISFFTKEYWHLLIRVARYYQTPFIRVVRSALPPGLLSRSQRRIRLSQRYLSQIKEDRSRLQSYSPLAERLIETVAGSPSGDYSWQYLQRQLGRHDDRRHDGGSDGGSASGRAASRRAINLALQQMINQGVVESYLVTPRSPQAQKRQAVFLVNVPTDSASDPSADGLSKRQREILQSLERAGGELWLSDALQLLNTTSKTLKKIADLGYLVIEPKEMLRAGSHSRALPDVPKALTSDQAKALAVLHQMSGYAEALLHGVTGSGKTEVYLQAIAPILTAQKSALVLVPEIGLTPQLTDRFRSRFGSKVCVYHSGLSEGERYDTWRQMLSGEPQVIIGTRSAVFSPLPNLGMIVLDEEHDGSFKQDQPMPCYHARTVAQWRAELEGCPLILGSATPSIETWVRFRGLENETKGLEQRDRRDAYPTRGSRQYLSLPRRVRDRSAPPVEVVDMRQELHEGNRTIFSRPLQLALEEMIEQGNQGILFIHRRGHSSFVSCRSCGHVMDCPNCDVSLSFHQTHQNATARLKCHYCGYAKIQPEACPACASPYLKNFGSGTQRVVNDLAKYLPQARCIRFDSDTTRNKGAHRALLSRFAQGEADLLVGTQMLTKGIDLPQVTLVGVIAADGLLFMPDYRASERAFQTMTQVAGRAGRGEQKGRVIVQTYSPEHVAVKALTLAGSSENGQVPSQAKNQVESQVESYGTFLRAEMRDRAEQQYPPYGRLILLRISGMEAPLVEQTAEKLAEELETHLHQIQQQSQQQPERLNAIAALSEVAELEIAELEDLPYRILGPVPAPILRVARRYRWHILLKLSSEGPLPDLKPLRRHCPKGISLTIDVEPLNLS